MIGALRLAVFSRPRKRSAIGMVTPTTDINRRYGISTRFILIRRITNGRRTSPPKKSRKNAKVRGGTSLNDHLKMGKAAPQTILAMMREATANL